LLLDKLAVAEVTRASFRIEGPVSMLPCGALFLVTHVFTGEQYTLRQEVKSKVVEQLEQARQPLLMLLPYRY
jgi:hypothetical protein